MRLTEFWNKIMKTPAKDWYYAPIQFEQTPKDIPATTPAPNSCYINVHLKSMRIVNVRNAFKTFYPVVHSFFSLKYIGNSKAEFNTVTTPTDLQALDAKNLDKVLTLNRRLLGPIPYRGGDINFDIGLFAVQLTDLAKPFLTLLTEMSTLAGVSFIGKVLPYTDTISKGIDLLVGNTNTTKLEIGISTDLDKITTGYTVLIAGDKSEIQTSELYIDRNDYKLVNNNGAPFREYPYLVIAISASTNKDDWFDIPELAASYEALRNDIRKGDVNAATESLKTFKRIVRTSNDLLPGDTKKIVKTVEDEVNEILDTIQVADEKLAQLKPLNEFKIY